MTREEIKEHLKNQIAHFEKVKYGFRLPEDYIRYEEQQLLLELLEQEPKTGHWINAKVGKFFPSNDYKCSECGNILNFDGVNCGRGDANYCPHCGAKMGEVEE